MNDQETCSICKQPAASCAAALSEAGGACWQPPPMAGGATSAEPSMSPGEVEVLRRRHRAFADASRRQEEREAYLEVGGAAFAEEEEPARLALLELSRRLRALSEEGFGDAGADARAAWAFSLAPLRTLQEQAIVLRFVDAARRLLQNRSEGHAALVVKRELPARQAADAALEALSALMDTLRARAPEHLR